MASRRSANGPIWQSDGYPSDAGLRTYVAPFAHQRMIPTAETACRHPLGARHHRIFPMRRPCAGNKTYARRRFVVSFEAVKANTGGGESTPATGSRMPGDQPEWGRVEKPETRAVDHPEANQRGLRGAHRRNGGHRSCDGGWVFGVDNLNIH